MSSKSVKMVVVKREAEGHELMLNSKSTAASILYHIEKLYSDSCDKPNAIATNETNALLSCYLSLQYEIENLVFSHSNWLSIVAICFDCFRPFPIFRLVSLVHLKIRYFVVACSIDSSSVCVCIVRVCL